MKYPSLDRQDHSQHKKRDEGTRPELPSSLQAMAAGHSTKTGMRSNDNHNDSSRDGHRQSVERHDRRLWPRLDKQLR